MDFDAEWLGYLPDVPEEHEWRTDERHDFFGRAGELLTDEQLLPSLFWTLALCDEERQWRSLATSLPRFHHAEVGFVDPDRDAVEPGLAVLLFTAEERVDGYRLGFVEIGANVFPVLARSVRETLHVQIAGPYAGCTACWAISRRFGPLPCDGWLTAGHVVPDGVQLQLSDGTSSWTVDRAGACVDAAVVSGTQPGALSAFSATIALVGGLAVQLADQNGGLTSTHVRSVASTFGMITSVQFPVRFSLDRYGQAGDSGAAIWEDATNPPLAGIYLGQYDDPQGNPAGGIGLAAYQLEALMDMELYR